MARRRKNNGFSQPMISFEYFFTDTSALQIRTVLRTAARTTNLRHCDGLALIFVRRGRGELIVNTRRFPIERGSLFMLSDYQFYQLSPARRSELEYVECQFSYRLYLFFVSSPYFRFTVPGFGPDPVIAKLEGKYLETAERLMNLQLKSQERERSGQREVLQVMELMGILVRSSRAESVYPNPPPEGSGAKSARAAKKAPPEEAE